MANSELSKQVAKVLVEIGAIKVTTSTPIRFKSGIVSPIYVDNRNLPFHFAAWHTVINAFQDLIVQDSITFDIIAGMAVGGVPHSAALAYSMRKPSIFVRKEAKEHGTQQRVEGGDVTGKRVILIEDLITTGGSSLSGVAALRESGAIVSDCLAIVSYGFLTATEAFDQATINLHTLTEFALIQELLRASGQITESEADILADWLNSPIEWAERNGK